MFLSDKAIMSLCAPASSERMVHTALGMIEDHPNGRPMIEPFIDHQVRTACHGGRPGDPQKVRTSDPVEHKVVSYGLSSAGYDVRLVPEFKCFTRPNDGRIIDVLNFRDEEYAEYVEAESIVIPPGGFVASRTVEHFSMPNRVVGQCLGKSTWARAGLLINVTPLEPGWTGHLVVELTNGSNLPLRVYANMGIGQIMFGVLNEEPSVSYSKREGKYNDQEGVALSRL